MTKLTENQLAILAQRGIGEETAEKLGWRGVEGHSEEWMQIPYVKGKQEAGVKNRTISGEKKFFADWKNEPIFYNQNAITDKDLQDEPLIIVEGEMDLAILIQCGYKRVISVPNGAGGTEFKFIRPVLKDLNKVPVIYICGDNDDKGQGLINNLATELTAPKCKKLPVPKDCNDLNEAFLKHGKRGIDESFNRAQWIEIGGIYRMDDLPKLPEKAIYDIGIPGFEEHFNVRKGDFCVVTGIPSMGKSTFVSDFVCRIVQKHGWNACFAAFETSPQDDHLEILTTWHAGKPYAECTEIDRGNALKWINEKFTFIAPSLEDDPSIEWVLQRASAGCIRYGADIVVIDPWNEMDHAKPYDMTITEYTGQAIKMFKRFARKYNVFLVVVAHPTKQLKDKKGKFQIPTLYDISDSAHWANKADVGLVVHREEEGSRIKVAKSRYHNKIGKPGTLDVQYNERTGKFSTVKDRIDGHDYT